MTRETDPFQHQRQPRAVDIRHATEIYPHGWLTMKRLIAVLE